MFSLLILEANDFQVTTVSCLVCCKPENSLMIENGYIKTGLCWKGGLVGTKIVIQTTVGEAPTTGSVELTIKNQRLPLHI